MLAGIILSFHNARMNTLAEIASAEQSTLALFDTGLIDLFPSPNTSKQGGNKANLGGFKLQQLSHMRHLKIELVDKQGRQLDSNQIASKNKKIRPAPNWFVQLLNKTMPKWEPKVRHLTYQNASFATLIMTPDPTYEYAEIWKQMTDLMVLLSLFFVCVNLMIAWAISQALNPSDRILVALDQIEKGDLNVRLPHFQLPELARIAQKFNHMIETLQTSMKQNHSLAQQLITLQEAERKSLARDLHDEFGQCLTAIKADASVILKHANSKYPELKASASAISELSGHLMDIVSSLLQKLRPSVLDELGLSAALHDLVSSNQVRLGSIAFSLELNEQISDDCNHLGEAQSLVIYRLVQECLTNINRHANASMVNIKLDKHRHVGKDGVKLEVRDNGKGFNQKLVENMVAPDNGSSIGFGLLGMRERVEGLGGILNINSAPNQGTIIYAWIPL
jgi:two-component system, NarL family, sensor histidine kinase UhpB